MEDEIQDVKLMEVYDKDVIDAIKSRMKRTQLGKFYRQDECISVLSEQIYRFHLGGKSVDEILAFINDDLTVVRKEHILRVIQEHDAKPRKRRSRKPLSTGKSEAKPDISEIKPEILDVKPLESDAKPPEKGSRPDIRSPLKMRTHKSEAGLEELR